MLGLIFDTFREGYETDQVKHTMTVGELIAFLEDYDEDMPVYLGFDSRYTYGGIKESGFELISLDEEEYDE